MTEKPHPSPGELAGTEPGPVATRRRQRPRNLAGLYPRRPVLLAHRGASADAPANTLAAFRRAVETGADGVELDVHLSRDGQVIVIHDETVTSVTGMPGRVRDMTLAEIQALDAGSYFSPAFRGERIPTLEEVLNVLRPDMVVNVELKGTSARTEGLEQEVVRILRARQMLDRVIISSFNPFRLWTTRRLEPRLPRAMLHGPGTPVFVRQLWFLPLVRPDALHPHFSLVDAAYMDRARRWGMRVNVWTVDDATEARRLVDLGVDGIITNDPRGLRRALQG